MSPDAESTTESVVRDDVVPAAESAEGAERSVTLAANDDGVPAMSATLRAAAKVRLLRDHFFNRTDTAAILAPWGKPCPVPSGADLDAMLRAHVAGDGAAAVTVRYSNKMGDGTLTGRFRVGSYCPSTERTTRWLCIDLDGPGHSSALADPDAVARETLDAFAAVDLPAYLERSGSGNGWHVWCFFDPPLSAAKAQAIGQALAPRDASLARGGVADPKAGRGIEVFPKQSKVRAGGYGNLLWLPWWQGAPAGANTFHRVGPSGTLERYEPDQFAAASRAAIERVATACGRSPEARRTLPSAVAPDSEWTDWQSRALTAMPLDAVYGPWLTGRTAGTGWLECRSPESESGDQHASAGVADGHGAAARGTFHSFISGQSLSVFEFMVQHGGEPDMDAAVERVARLSGVAQPRDTRGGPSAAERPRVRIHTAEHLVVDEAIAALAAHRGVYCRGGELVKVVRQPSRLRGLTQAAPAPTMVVLNNPGIRDRLTASADWFRLNVTDAGVEELPAHPPLWVAPAVASRKHWPGVPPLEAIVDSPVIRPDGTVLEARGYDETTGLLHMPNARYPSLPAAPGRDEAIGAASRLLELVEDFPFASDAHRAGWLAGVLTPLARFGFRGPAPLFLFDANVRGAGKSLLADVTAEIVCGRPMPRTSQATDEAEESKRITSVAMQGQRLILIDNISRPFGSGPLDAALTSVTWRERKLGDNDMPELALLTVWYGTGNNVTFKGDTGRRCLHIRLDSNLERPERRAGFTYPNLLEWVHEHRAARLVDALTILRAFIAAGRPVGDLTRWGSYEGWSDLVRAAIVWCGLADPGETRSEHGPLDQDASALADLLEGWSALPGGMGLRGCTAAEALSVLRANTGATDHAQLRAAIDEICPNVPGQLPAPARLGRALARFRGRVIGNRKLDLRTVHGHNHWVIQHVGASQPVAENLALALDSGPSETDESHW